MQPPRCARTRPRLRRTRSSMLGAPSLSFNSKRQCGPFRSFSNPPPLAGSSFSRLLRTPLSSSAACTTSLRMILSPMPTSSRPLSGRPAASMTSPPRCASLRASRPRLRTTASTRPTSPSSSLLWRSSVSRPLRSSAFNVGGAAQERVSNY